MCRFRRSPHVQMAVLALRPLLYTARAAATAATAVLYYFLKQRDDDERRAEDGVSLSQTKIAVPPVTLDELEERYEQALNFHAHLQQDLHRVKSEMELLRASAKQKVCERFRVNRHCSRIQEEWEQFQDAYHTMIEKYIKLKESLKRFNHVLCDLVREKAKHSILKIKYKQLKKIAAKPDKELKIAKESCFEAEKKFEQVVELNSQARKENSDLISSSDMLQDHVYNLEKELLKIRCKNKNVLIKNQQVETDYRTLQSQYEVILKQRDDLLKEEKYALLVSRVNTLQDSVKHLEKELEETNGTYVELTKKRYQELEEQRFLTCQNQEMRETVQKCEELLKKLHTKDHNPGSLWNPQ